MHWEYCQLPDEGEDPTLDSLVDLIENGGLPLALRAVSDALATAGAIGDPFDHFVAAMLDLEFIHTHWGHTTDEDGQDILANAALSILRCLELRERARAKALGRADQIAALSKHPPRRYLG